VIGLTRRSALVVGLCFSLCGCEGVQSVLAPVGPEAERTAKLFWILVIGSSVITITVVLLVLAALIGSNVWRMWLARERIVIAGGLVFPALTLSALLLFDLYTMRSNPAEAVGESIRISVVGERWWWRIGYKTAGGQRFETANELHIPAGVPVAVELAAADVIHSFWVPKLAGKLDMIPGRTTILHLQANEPGVSRGQCAEFCGGPHALMAFNVVAMDSQAFRDWLAKEASTAIAPADSRQAQGQNLFLGSGCGGCHTIRGTLAKGIIGPDLTHIGGRMSLAAATLPNNAGALASWIKDNQHIKPENRMPQFRIFTEAEMAALSSYLTSLK
jgi:cytochrome c oxidase subunit 2